MKKTFELSAEHVGAAITRYVGMKLAGKIRFYYHISESSWAIRFPLTVTAQQCEERQPIQPAFGTTSLGVLDITHELTRAEIIEAIWFSLPLAGLKNFRKLTGDDVSVEIPETVEIILSPVPSGAHRSKYPHGLTEVD